MCFFSLEETWKKYEMNNMLLWDMSVEQNCKSRLLEEEDRICYKILYSFNIVLVISLFWIYTLSWRRCSSRSSSSISSNILWSMANSFFLEQLFFLLFFSLFTNDTIHYKGLSWHELPIELAWVANWVRLSCDRIKLFTSLCLEFKSLKYVLSSLLKF